MLEQAEAFGLLPAPERDAAGGPLLDEEESVLQKFGQLQLVIGGSEDQGAGTLYITEWRIFWLSTADAQLGYCCEFPTITMHAVASDEGSSNKPCLYLQLDSGEEGEDGGGAGGSSDSEGEEEGGEGPGPELSPELRLIPADATQLEDMFQAFCEGAERNPDFSDDDDEAGGFFYNEDEVLAGAAAAQIGIDDVNELVGEDPSRFDDAEDEEEEEAAEPGSGSGQQNGGC